MVEKDTSKLIASKIAGTECTQLTQTPLDPEEYKVTKRLRPNYKILHVSQPSAIRQMI